MKDRPKASDAIPRIPFARPDHKVWKVSDALDVTPSFALDAALLSTPRLCTQLCILSTPC